MNTLSGLRLLPASLFLFALTAAGAPASSVDNPKALPHRFATIQLVADERYRAIFCGDDGAETSFEYSKVLASDLDRLEATGRTAAESLAYIKSRACRGRTAVSRTERPRL